MLMPHVGDNYYELASSEIQYTKISLYCLYKETECNPSSQALLSHISQTIVELQNAGRPL